MNLLESVRKNLGYEPLQKVDPNIQEVKTTHEMTSDQKLAQAAIPAVLAGLIKYSDTNEGLNIITMGNEDWLRLIFREKEPEVIQKVVQYSGVSTEQAADTMKKIAGVSVDVVKENVKKNFDAVKKITDVPYGAYKKDANAEESEKLRSYMNSQRHSILNHLPATLEMGHLLNEESFDDRTNKMEGPVSSFLHKIENII
jgi:hypothetical protein